MPHPKILATVLALGTSLSAPWASAYAGERPVEPFVYADARLEQVAPEIAAAGEGYVLMMGDSNAQGVKPGMLACPGPFVNMGVGGIRAEQFLAMLRKAPPLPDGGAGAILNVGTGNLWRKRNPGSEEAMREFDESIEGVVRIVKPHVRTVVVAAIPPLGGRGAIKLDTDLVETYSLRAKAICARLGCTYMDPWTPVRGASFGMEVPGTSEDGLHPYDLKGLYAPVAAMICRSDKAATLSRGKVAPN